MTRWLTFKVLLGVTPREAFGEVAQHSSFALVGKMKRIVVYLLFSFNWVRDPYNVKTAIFKSLLFMSAFQLLHHLGIDSRVFC